MTPKNETEEKWKYRRNKKGYVEIWSIEVGPIVIKHSRSFLVDDHFEVFDFNCAKWRGVIMEELLSQLILNGVESEYLDSRLSSIVIKFLY
ncbi:hypothetical protein BSK52_14545 [Paenibacillus odorifer]|uniref:Uncharacterized protein n=1 Tax=Paenibacillus odorifer TaxID=189426 RepID=A0A1R0XYD9_9BACL|nr:hypothetical protein BSK52_14545 [Paenibacillus odorifer]